MSVSERWQWSALISAAEAAPDPASSASPCRSLQQVSGVRSRLLVRGRGSRIDDPQFCVVIMWHHNDIILRLVWRLSISGPSVSAMSWERAVKGYVFMFSSFCHGFHYFWITFDIMWPDSFFWNTSFGFNPSKLMQSFNVYSDFSWIKLEACRQIESLK